jgi:hypothetical protein
MRSAVVDEAAVGGFDALSAGPALAAALEDVDPASLVGEDVAAWMRAGFRSRNHADWLLLRAIREACSARSGTTTRTELDEFAPKIAAAGLGWSSSMAAARVDLAVGILERMPALGERLRLGTLELAKAAAFVTGLEGLTDAQCAAVLASLLDDAPDLPIGRLRDRILAAAYDVDPVWAANRLAAATARARVSTETNPSGAVNVCGRDLPPELAADAKARLRALALAVRARLRAMGCRRPLGFVEARVFIRLMDGTQAGADDARIIAAVSAELTTADGPEDTEPDGGPDDTGPDDEDPDDTGPNDGGPGESGPEDHGPGDDAGPNDTGPNDGGPDDTGPDDHGPGDDAGPDDTGPDDEDPDDTGPNDGGPDDTGPDDHGPDDSYPDDSGSTPDHAAVPGSDPVSGPEHAVIFAPEVAVRLELSTLLGLDDSSGVLPGLGPVPAATARAAARARGAATWQLLIHDEHGRLQHLLVLRGPPGPAVDPRHRRQSVQITAPAGLLHALDPAAPPETALGHPGPGIRPLVLDAPTTEWLRRAREALACSESAHPEDHPATTTRERDRRFPGAALARWVRARDQTCIAPWCARPAETCDVDHTLDWLHGGPTEAGGLDTLCRHDHRGKHEGGWVHEQPEPGCFVITDPTGTRHHVESRVVRPRPTAVSPGYALAPDPGPWPGPREDWAPRRTRDGRITAAAHETVARLARRHRAGQRQPPSRYDQDPDF